MKTWNNWKRDHKDRLILSTSLAEAHTALLTRVNTHLDNQSDKYKDIKEARKRLSKYGITDEQQIQMACLRDTPAAREAYQWFYNFVSLVGDSAPNKNEKIEIPKIYTKESIHYIYKKHVENLYSGNEHAALGFGEFLKIIMMHDIMICKLYIVISIIYLLERFAL